MKRLMLIVMVIMLGVVDAAVVCASHDAHMFGNHEVNIIIIITTKNIVIIATILICFLWCNASVGLASVFCCVLVFVLFVSVLQGPACVALHLVLFDVCFFCFDPHSAAL